MTYVPTDVIEVSAWGQVVGAVARDPATGFFAFEYDRDWIRGGVELAPLHMPLSPQIYLFPELPTATFYRLPAMLADALPDRFGNSLVDAWMAEQGIESSLITPLDRLAYASNRAMGALTFRPPVGPNSADQSAVQLADLVTAARAQISGNLGDSDDIHRALAELITVGSTAGGCEGEGRHRLQPVHRADALGSVERSGRIRALAIETRRRRRPRRSTRPTRVESAVLPRRVRLLLDGGGRGHHHERVTTLGRRAP